MKKLYRVLAFLFIALTLVACGKKDKSENTTTAGDTVKPASGDVIIKIGHVEPESRSTHKALVNFKKNVEEKSNGKIGIEIYPNGSLGGDVQMTESVAMGTLQSTLPSTSVLTTYSEEFGILDMPYLFLNSESAFNALDGEVGEYFNKKLEEQGIKCLGYAYNGPRSTTTNSGPIEKPEDLKGVKMRVMESPIFIDFYKTIGANPTPMSFTELYTGLQQGTVDAQENPPSLTFANKFYEVQKYQTIDEHVHNFLPFLINKNVFDSLDSDMQELLESEAKVFVEEQRKMELVDNEKAVKDLETEGKLITNVLDDSQKLEFRKAVQPMYDKYQKQFGQELFDLCEKYNK
ncbi:MAG: TRAP transporter substrate-binding protein [Peptoniphilus grossensis]|uniref:TRAP transporter substrate-binding protein n=1 Tax=Peptoniphilus grossensis TaxID=1465756 RepID=UPI00290D9BC0|nr:TRAP transporter substrate-binding protein [Peptoniphilus grossensis]MDU5100524.1 TRAP transporter substrate-binding protein [Peptoniphilus grossensis]